MSFTFHMWLFSFSASFLSFLPFKENRRRPQLLEQAVKLLHLGTEILSGLLIQISWLEIIVSSQVNWSDWWCLIIVCFSCLGIYWLGNCHELLVIFVQCLAVSCPSVGMFLIALTVQLPKILAFVEFPNNGRRKYSSHLKKMTP